MFKDGYNSVNLDLIDSNYSVLENVSLQPCIKWQISYNINLCCIILIFSKEGSL